MYAIQLLNKLLLKVVDCKKTAVLIERSADIRLRLNSFKVKIYGYDTQFNSKHIYIVEFLKTKGRLLVILKSLVNPYKNDLLKEPIL